MKTLQSRKMTSVITSLIVGVTYLFSATVVRSDSLTRDVKIDIQDVRLIAASDGSVAGIWPDGNLVIRNVSNQNSVLTFRPLATDEKAQNFVLSDNSLHLAAIEYMKGEINDRLIFVSLLDYEKNAAKWKLNVFDLGINHVLGFSQDATNLICRTANGKIYGLDVKTGSAKCLASFSDLLESNGRYLNAIQVSPTCTYFCAIFNDYACVRDAEGKDIWSAKLSPKTDDRAFDLMSDRVVLLNTLSSKVEIRDFATGIVRASIQPTDLSKVHSVAANATRTAVAIDSTVELQIDERGKSIVLDNVNTACELAFTSDGKHLVCLPELQWTVGASSQGSVLHVHRASNIATIFDADTGKRQGELNLSVDRP